MNKSTQRYLEVFIILLIPPYSSLFLLIPSYSFLFLLIPSVLFCSVLFCSVLFCSVHFYSEQFYSVLLNADLFCGWKVNNIILSVFPHYILSSRSLSLLEVARRRWFVSQIVLTGYTIRVETLPQCQEECLSW